MKKQKPSSFKNTPFGSLKPLKTGKRDLKEEPSPLPRKAEDESDNTGLFVREMEGVTRLGAAPSKKRPQQAAEPKKSSPASGADDEQIFLKAMQSMGTRFEKKRAEQEDEDRGRQSSAARMQQLKRGTIRIGGELDLHGHFRDEALVRLEQFIADAYHQGLEAVLVITGKGVNSPEGPVLPGAVSTWLRREGRSMVAEFAPAPRELGGAGAFVVFLRRRENG